MSNFAGIFSDLSGVISDVFDGRSFDLVTADGVALSCPGVFKRSHRELNVGEYGAKSWVPVPRLDLARPALAELEISDPAVQLHGASVTIDGTHFLVVEVRDGEVFSRCLLSLDLDHA